MLSDVRRLAGRTVAQILLVAALVVAPAGGAAPAEPVGPVDPSGPGHRSTGGTPSSTARAGLVVSQVVAIRAPAAPPDRERTARWAWPLVGTPQIARGFDLPEQRWAAGHRGIDLVGVLAEPVLAVEAGVVTYSGVIAGVGIVSVTHEDGLRSTYQPLDDRPRRGTRVGRGDAVGRLAEGGHCVARDCLHLGAVRGADDYVDPTPLLLGVELTLLSARD